MNLFTEMIGKQIEVFLNTYRRHSDELSNDQRKKIRKLEQCLEILRKEDFSDRKVGIISRVNIRRIHSAERIRSLH